MESKIRTLAARGMTLMVVILSSIGILSIPVGEYDDSVLLLGARLVLAGRLPYVDFYANYGPLGYSILAALMREIPSPALALRVGQIGLLGALAFLAHWVTARRDATNPAGTELVVPLAVLGLSMEAVFPSFFGFAFAIVALFLFIQARRADSISAGWAFAALGGLALALTTLTRPAFGAYAGGAVVLGVAPLIGSRSGRTGGGRTTLGLFLVSFVLGGVLLWLLLFREIPVRAAFDAAVKGPTYLLTGERYVERLPLEAFAAGFAIAGASLIWGFALPGRRGKNRAAFFVMALGFLPLLVRSGTPARPLSWLGILSFPAALLLVFLERRALSASPDVAAAALLGLASAAFAHYSWTRPDAPHLLPALVLGAFGATLIWRRFRPTAAAAVAALFVVGFYVAASGWYWTILPIERLRTARLRQSGRWQCEEVYPDAAKAVRLADRNADPASRFVAVASSHVSSQGNPVLLFLISARLPYTKWYHYDPGLQSSAPIQSEMKRELLGSGSRTAVVWWADRFADDRRKIPGNRISSFDEFFNRLYPTTVKRFGDYEVRSRSPLPAAARP